MEHPPPHPSPSSSSLRWESGRSLLHRPPVPSSPRVPWVPTEVASPWEGAREPGGCREPGLGSPGCCPVCPRGASKRTERAAGDATASGPGRCRQAGSPHDVPVPGPDVPQPLTASRTRGVDARTPAAVSPPVASSPPSPEGTDPARRHQFKKQKTHNNNNKRLKITPKKWREPSKPRPRGGGTGGALGTAAGSVPFPGREVAGGGQGCGVVTAR